MENSGPAARNVGAIADGGDAQSPVATPTPRIGAATEHVIDWSRRHARPLVLGVLLVTMLLGWFATTHIGIDASTARLIDPNLSWKQQQFKYNQSFPQFDNLLVIVIDGVTPDIAADAAAALTDRLRQEHGQFTSVYQPDFTSFFRRNGLLFLSVDEVAEITDQLAQSQPLIGTLAADPSVNGLFTALNLALQGIAGGEIEPTFLEPPLQNIADSLASALDGQVVPLSWQVLLTGDQAPTAASRRIILAKPILDFGELAPGAAASATVRAAIKELQLAPDRGVTVRLTGEVALDDEEFSTVVNGTGTATMLSLVLVLLLLFLALRSPKPILAIVATLVIGLIWTLAFAAATVGSLNLISVAFAVMFVGIAVDFGIQVSVRYRDERYRVVDPILALQRTGRGIGGPLAIAAATTTIGFLAFVPTAYRGVSELGIIAGAGMVIALVLNLTLLPALLTILRMPGEPRPVDTPWAAGIDRFLLRRRRPIMLAAMALAVASALLLPGLSFDFNPLKLKDPKSESVQALHALMADQITTPNTMNVLVGSRAQVPELAARLGALPDVRHAVSILSFIPPDQDDKLAMIGDVALFMLPSLSPPTVAPTPDIATTIATIKETIERLHGLPAGEAGTPRRLAMLLDQAIAMGGDGAALLDRVLLTTLPGRLAGLKDALSAGPIDFESLPEELRRDWISPDGKYRIEVFPRGDSNDNPTLVRFVDAVRAVAPDAIGTAYFIQVAGEVVWQAFQIAGLFALASVAILLFVVLRRPRDVALVILPLLFAGLLTSSTVVLTGQQINFANVITLPLLFGIGVAFNIYFVMNWRAGRAGPLQSSTARAVFFSALTTLSAFGSLSISKHVGTAAMGLLLTICLLYTLATTLLLLPALLGPVPESSAVSKVPST
ncbi:MAG: MMPL family transporter [Dongiaceae bacterium]